MLTRAFLYLEPKGAGNLLVCLYKINDLFIAGLRWVVKSGAAHRISCNAAAAPLNLRCVRFVKFSRKSLKVI